MKIGDDEDSAGKRRSKWLTSCSGKEPFDTMLLAKKVADRRRSRGRNSRPYRCEGCGKYHLGEPKR